MTHARAERANDEPTDGSPAAPCKKRDCVAAVEHVLDGINRELAWLQEDAPARLSELAAVSADCAVQLEAHRRALLGGVEWLTYPAGRLSDLRRGALELPEELDLVTEESFFRVLGRSQTELWYLSRDVHQLRMTIDLALGENRPGTARPVTLLLSRAEISRKTAERLEVVVEELRSILYAGHGRAGDKQFEERETELLAEMDRLRTYVLSWESVFEREALRYRVTSYVEAFRVQMRSHGIGQGTARTDRATLPEPASESGRLAPLATSVNAPSHADVGTSSEAAVEDAVTVPGAQSTPTTGGTPPVTGGTGTAGGPPDAPSQGATTDPSSLDRPQQRMEDDANGVFGSTLKRSCRCRNT